MEAKLRSIVSSAVIILAAACGQSTDDETVVITEPVAERVPAPSKADLETLLTEFDVPGVAMAPIDGCAVGEVVVAGQADLESGAPVTPDTVFEAASLTKPVFAYLVMTLVEEGVIDLDRPLAETFDYARIPDKDRYAKITPRMVLSHRTGLPNWVGEDVLFHQRTTPIPFDAEPGEAFTYSGEGYQLLQAFVERETGKPLQQLFEERLGSLMPRSTLARPLPSGVRPSRGYDLASDPGSGRGMINLRDRAMAASSLVTTADDYARFLSRICRREGLRAESYDDMLRPQSPVAPDAPSPSWSLGFTIADVDGATFIGHTGNNDEYRALGGFLKETGEGLVLLTNGGNGSEMIDVAARRPDAN